MSVKMAGGIAFYMVSVYTLINKEESLNPVCCLNSGLGKGSGYKRLFKFKFGKRF